MYRRTVFLEPLSLAYLDNQVSGLPLLMIHGNSDTKESFQSQFSALSSAGFRLLVPDLPGHGESSRDKRADTDGYVYTVAYYAAVLEAFLSALDIRSPVFVGHSLGGHIALRMAREVQPRALVLLGTPPLETFEDIPRGFTPQEAGKAFFTEKVGLQTLEKLRSLLFPRGNDSDAFIGRFLTTDPRSRRNLAASMVPEAEYAEVTTLGNLQCPVLFCLGEEDPLVEGEYLREIVRGVPAEPELVFLPDCAHHPHEQEPEIFNTLLLRFLGNPEI